MRVLPIQAPSLPPPLVPRRPASDPDARVERAPCSLVTGRGGEGGRGLTRPPKARARKTPRAGPAVPPRRVPRPRPPPPPPHGPAPLSCFLSSRDAWSVIGPRCGRGGGGGRRGVCAANDRGGGGAPGARSVWGDGGGKGSVGLRVRGGEGARWGGRRKGSRGVSFFFRFRARFVTPPPPLPPPAGALACMFSCWESLCSQQSSPHGRKRERKEKRQHTHTNTHRFLTSPSPLSTRPPSCPTPTCSSWPRGPPPPTAQS